MPDKNEPYQAETPMRLQTKLEQLVSQRNRLQEQLNIIDRKIELIHKNPIIKEFLELS